MSLLSLPAELRAQIYTHLIDLHPTVPKTISHYKVPPICRTCRILRHDTFLIYVGNCKFTIYLYEDDISRDFLRKWLDTLGVGGIGFLRDIKFSRRWDERVGFELRLGGFEVRLVRLNGVGRWGCEGHTYPLKGDGRGLRYERVQSLRRVIEARLLQKPESEEAGLTAHDVAFVLRAMDVVAERASDSDNCFRADEKTAFTCPA